MVFRVRGTLTKEDRAAWRRLAVRYDRSVVKKYRTAKRERLKMKLSAWLMLIISGVGLFAAVSGGISPWMAPLMLFLIITGIFLLFFVKQPEIKPPTRLFEYDFPPSDMPDTPVRAAFFEDGCFVFWNAAERVRLGYAAITAAWEDAERFYLFLRNRPPLVLPKRGFAGEMSEDFRGFLGNTIDFPMKSMK